jgi:hypothetical protein
LTLELPTFTTRRLRCKLGLRGDEGVQIIARNADPADPGVYLVAVA